jgi:cyclohexanecarboxylate-CoA ligase
VRTTREELIQEYCRRGWVVRPRITDLFDAALQRPARPGSPWSTRRTATALIGGAPRRLTFRQVADLADGYALRLRELGLGRDDVLITQLPNVVEYVAVYLAAMRLGIVVSPVPMQFRRHELAEIVATHRRARHAHGERDLKGVEHAAGAVQLAAERPLQVLCLGSSAAGRVAVRAGAAQRAPRAPRCARTSTALGVDADDIVTICWTSGTEGLPKGVPRSHNLWIAISWAHLRGAGIQRGERLLNPFPLINMAALGGCFMSWLHSAGTLLLHHPLDLPVYLRQIAEERPQYAIAPPAILNMLLKDEDCSRAIDLSSLRCLGSGSAPLDPEMIAGYQQRFGIEVINIFGSNEGVSLLTNAAERAPTRRTARGSSRAGAAPKIEWPIRRSPVAIRTRIVDPDTSAEILERGRPGEMQITGPSVFDGYFRAPQLTEKAFTADGWFRTGDLFEIEGDREPPQYYRFVGRLKQIIVRGGMKIAPGGTRLGAVADARGARRRGLGLCRPDHGRADLCGCRATPGCAADARTGARALRACGPRDLQVPGAAALRRTVATQQRRQARAQRPRADRGRAGRGWLTATPCRSRAGPRRPRQPCTSPPRSLTTTRAPSASAWQRPRPAPAPVKVATRPSKRMLMDRSSSLAIDRRPAAPRVSPPGDPSCRRKTSSSSRITSSMRWTPAMPRACARRNGLTAVG